MKNLILIIYLSSVGTVLSTDQYPYVAQHYPSQSRVPKQCEENATAKWGTEEIAESCESLNFAFPVLVHAISPQIFPWTIREKNGSARSISIKGPVDVLLEKRDLIKKHAFTKKNMATLREHIDIIVSPLNLSEHDKRKEMEFCQHYFLISAEYTTKR